MYKVGNHIFYKDKVWKIIKITKKTMTLFREEETRVIQTCNKGRILFEKDK